MRPNYADSLGNSPQQPNNSQGNNGHATHHLSAMQRPATEQDGPVLECHVQAGWGAVALLALRMDGRRI